MEDDILTITVGTTGELLVVGELDMSSAATLKRFAAEHRRASNEPVVLDLSELHFIDSAGIAALLTVMGRGPMRISFASPVVARLLGLTGLADAFGLPT